jgi:hypothetical protein
MEKAFDKNDFKKFNELLISTYYEKGSPLIPRITMKQQTSIFEPRGEIEKSLFGKMLASKERKASKYISLVLKHYNLGSDNEFYSKTNAQQQTWTQLVADTEDTEILFSFLMFDWFYAETTKNIHYCLLLKAQYNDFRGKTLVERLIEIIQKSEKKLHNDIAVKIIYQLIYEMDEAKKELADLIIKKDIVVEKIEKADKQKKSVVKLTKREEEFEIQIKNVKKSLKLFSDEQKIDCITEASKIEDDECKQQLLQVFIVFWIEDDDEKFKIRFKESPTVLLNTATEFFELVFLLKEKKTVEFEEKFEEWVQQSVNDLKMNLKPQIRLFLKICEAHELLKATEFIFRKYPDVGQNSTIMTSFNSVQDFKNCYYLQTKEMEKLVRNLKNH